jgi:60 kDa SS-A/Ro ribonucleoprotein
MEMRISREVKNQYQKESLRRVTNFMGGNSYELNALDTLKIVSASSIFGEPSYYRDGEFEGKTINDGLYSVHSLVKNSVILDDKYSKMKTSEIMEKLIDEALDHDFYGTLLWAKELRHNFYMRLNPQIIMVRAATHPKRKEFTENNGSFSKIINDVMFRLDEPSSQLAYYLYKNGKGKSAKKGLPSILKRAWAKKIESASKYQLYKYKNSGLGLINVIRICHANNENINELMTTGNIALEDSNSTWENLKSQGKSWKDILLTIDIGHMALLRNLRGIFTEINDLDFAKEVMVVLRSGVANGKQFPYRYHSAYNAISECSVNHKSLILDTLNECMDLSCENLPKLEGRTMCLSDNSGSAWGAITSEFGTVKVAEIDNLSSLITARNSDEGFVGIFGDRLEILPVSKRDGLLTQLQKANSFHRSIGGSTENGIWIFFRDAIKKKEHWDNIFIYSDQQAGHGGLYGTDEDCRDYSRQGFATGRHIDVMKLINKYRSEVNPKVNVYTVQTAGYTNVLIPENFYRGAVLFGWTGKELLYAKKVSEIWDSKESKQ